MAASKAHLHHAPRTWAGIALAGAAGSALRYGITSGGGWATIVIANVLGCAVLGALVGLRRASPALAIGFCGGLTTFSGVAAQASAAARNAGPGAWHAVTGAFSAQHLGGALALLAANGLAGLAAFLVGREAGSGRAAPPLSGPHRGQRPR